MKFIKFSDWIKNIHEETREERRLRELEAKRREEELFKHLDREEDHKSIERAHGYTSAPTDADEIIAREKFRQNLPGYTSHPVEDYIDSVYDNIEKVAGFSHLYDFPDSPKGEADMGRIHDLLHDCYDDGTSENDATNMAIELLKRMKYI